MIKTFFMKIISIIFRIVVALILLQTLYFKFTAHPESVYIFETVGMEPAGRIGIGILELISALLILFPKTVTYGAILTLGIIGGAIMMHLTKLGIDVRGDGGYLFYLALTTFLSALVVLIIHRKEIPIIGSRL